MSYVHTRNHDQVVKNAHQNCTQLMVSVKELFISVSEKNCENIDTTKY